MKKLLKWTAPVALAACVCGLLKADVAVPPPSLLPGNDYVWFVEHTAAVAKDPDASAVRAVIEAKDLLKGKEPQVAIDFFMKALYDTKSRAVQREIRMTLYQLYKDQGQTDKALDQLQQLIVGQE
jgi:lipopolysaccharide biosynthesis regulator YciM